MPFPCQNSNGRICSMGTSFLDHIPACGWITLSWWPDENVNGLPAIRWFDGTVM